MRQALVVVCLIGCGHGGSSGSGGDAPKWTKAKLVSTTVDASGVPVTVSVPEGLPQNKESLEGPDWRMPNLGPGPSIHIRKTSHVFASADELAHDVEPDKLPSIVDVSKGAVGTGGFEYVSAKNGNHHLDVTVWLPVDQFHGIEASCHWYSEGAKPIATPDPELIAWLKSICEAIRVGK